MSNSMRGFKGFGRPDYTGDDANLEDRLKRLSIENRFIYWTGLDYKGRPQSLRYKSLHCLKVEKAPVPLADWIRLAARIVGPDRGFDPSSVRAGLQLHWDSKPAVFYELKREEDGSYTSVRNYPNAEPKPIKAGDVIVPAATKEEPAQIEVKGETIQETAPSKAKRAVARTRAKGKPAAAKKAG